MSKSLSTSDIRQKINIAFDDSGFSAFCFDYYPIVYESFTQGMRKNEKITSLLDYCRRHPSGFETFRDNVRKEYKTSNFHREELKPLIDALSVYISWFQVIETTSEPPPTSGSGPSPSRSKLQTVLSGVVLLLLMLFCFVVGTYIFAPPSGTEGPTEPVLVESSVIPSETETVTDNSPPVLAEEPSAPIEVLPATKTPITPPSHTPITPPSYTPVVGTSNTPLPSPTNTPLSTETLFTEMPFGPRPTLSPLPSEERGLIKNGPRDQRLVALTFNAIQTPEFPAGYDRDIERVLLETETPATIFLGGDWMRYHPEETKFLYDHPLFELANHGWAHIDFEQATVEEMVPEIEKTQEMMWHLIGFQSTLFRFPSYDRKKDPTEEALQVVEDHGLRAIKWDVVSGDPDPDFTASIITSSVVDEVEPGSIIVMHINGRGWHTAEALPDIIDTLREQGYRFVTVSELLGLEVGP